MKGEGSFSEYDTDGDGQSGTIDIPIRPSVVGRRWNVYSIWVKNDGDGAARDIYLQWAHATGGYTLIGPINVANNASHLFMPATKLATDDEQIAGPLPSTYGAWLNIRGLLIGDGAKILVRVHRQNGVDT